MSPVTANAATDTALVEPGAARTGFRIVLVGPPGAGKGTQAKVIAAHLDVPIISTGEIFRFSATQDTPLGRHMRELMASGALIPDDMTIEVVRDRLTRADVANGFLLDGFPRTVPQAIALDGILTDAGTAIDVVLALAVDQDEVVSRLAGRRNCVGCKPPRTWHVDNDPPAVPGVCDDCGGRLFRRDDDAPAVVRTRLAEYAANTAPLIDFYRAQNKLADLDAMGPVADITRRALDVLNR